MSSAVLGRLRATGGQQFILLPLLVVMFVGLAMLEPRVASASNLRNVLTQASYLALFAAAQSMVILVRGFDLSLGTSVSFVSVTLGLVMTRSGLEPMQAVLVAILAAALVSMAIGACNGTLVAVVGINPFVTTLGTTSILASLASIVSGGFPVAGLPEVFGSLASGEFLSIPVPVWIVAIVLFGLHVMLSRGRFGRYLYIIGANPRAAEVSGIPVKQTLVRAYVLCSLLAGLGAMLLTARTGSGEPNLGGNLTLETIAAAVLGGMSLRGGHGSMSAPVLGAVFVTVLSNGMNLVQIDGFLQQIVLGLVIVGSLALDRSRK